MVQLVSNIKIYTALNAMGQKTTVSRGDLPLQHLSVGGDISEFNTSFIIYEGRPDASSGYDLNSTTPADGSHASD